MKKEKKFYWILNENWFDLLVEKKIDQRRNSIFIGSIISYLLDKEKRKKDIVTSLSSFSSIDTYIRLSISTITRSNMCE